mmetsp:Transcript_6261/g.9094  ORF Transcript_6261/g.9094 Transcript_6261/m.9094 type:complete len:192 (+) Transcript_6261:74-649(+)|eukprot:CAMPEP_0184862954 /NCGR_PEP_ID=MMETSP0580-20130426/8169_1 /TAXON_ID=1118495 /ORGANISM="Dactyliosolen fragilissimus" /LENGTH=191 /DNA_ID=CAMNT_0027360979 /DNA_START=45 /DNA_END=620 /DNA_ORIENTATION=+
MSKVKAANDFPSEEEIRNNLNQYTKFVNEKLTPILKDAILRREETENEISEYEELASELSSIVGKDNEVNKLTLKNDKEKNIRRMKGLKEFRRAANSSQLETHVDLGAQIMFCKAIVPNPERVFVHVGMGFHVEFTLNEALEFIERRVKFLHKKVLANRVNKAKAVASDVESTLKILETLTEQLRELEKNH